MPVIAYFGPARTFTEMALDAILAGRRPVALLDAADADIERVAAPNPPAAIAMVRSGAADFACVPIESSLEGSVPATMDALVPVDGVRVQVFAEVILDIAFTIAAATPLQPDAVRTVAAYPVASAQVRETVARLFPNADFIVASSNAAAAQDVSNGLADAGVTTRPAAQALGLVALADGVADADDAATRFLLVGRPAPPDPPSGADRTAVILNLPNEPGSLMSAMNEFATRGVDLTRIESRPRRGGVVERSVDGRAMPSRSAHYRFFLDAVGHLDDDAVGETLRALHRGSDSVVFLGSWPADRGQLGAQPPDHSESVQWYESLRRGEN
ncbi:prephenate dehydratase [Gordonia sp. TBRC 11910]|uniref:Prephenate dehydratase n=1 Tax=Gordonia asplenii TaxID=2725283 RepID=A0A848L0C0_9ACTN|nr:prephenate dehydratase [Gordonia asplenii]NMO04364.1 prephenate dehydratase [Gordonia asplenii]